MTRYFTLALLCVLGCSERPPPPRILGPLDADIEDRVDAQRRDLGFPDATDAREPLDAMDVLDAMDAPAVDIVDVLTCDAGATPCNGECVNAQSDTRHCGACGTACAFANATPLCMAGMCRMGACNAGFADCNGNPMDGCESNLATDPAHCNACPTVCAFANATPTCVMGVCRMGACNPGFADCDMNPATGCEINLQTDPVHCNTCGRRCPGATNAAAACTGGVCGIRCAMGFDDCDGNATNGCEADVRAATAHCGLCGTACPSGPHARPVCTMGTCGIVCDAGFGNCDNNSANGCETNLQTDLNNCGACTVRCDPLNAQTAECVAGTCRLTCRDGFGDCDGMPSTGCESNTQTSLANCGRCGRACGGGPNTTSSCSAGNCASACNPGFADCNGSPLDGCEANLATDPGHCNACGRVCRGANNAAGACTGGACGVACLAGFASCDGTLANGCEINTQTSTLHCGACDRRCDTPSNGRPVCLMGLCAAACNAGFGDCDGNSANGCETNTQVTTAHCNGCGSACSAPNTSPACEAGACRYTCLPGFADCDATINPNGCEINTQINVLHCGACGNACRSPANATALCADSRCGYTCTMHFADCDAMAPNGCERRGAC